MISIHAYILGPLALLLVLQVVFMVKKYQRSSSIVYYSLFLFGLAALAAIDAILYSGWFQRKEVLLFRLATVDGLVTFFTLVLFSFHFPIPTSKEPKYLRVFMIVVVGLFTVLTLFTTMVIQGVQNVIGNPTEIRGSFYWIFPLAVTSSYIVTLINLFSRLRYVQLREFRLVRNFTIVLIVAAFLGVVFDVLFPALGYSRVPVGIYAALVLFGLSAYIVTRV